MVRIRHAYSAYAYVLRELDLRCVHRGANDGSPNQVDVNNGIAPIESALLWRRAKPGLGRDALLPRARFRDGGSLVFEGVRRPMLGSQMDRHPAAYGRHHRPSSPERECHQGAECRIPVALFRRVPTRNQDLRRRARRPRYAGTFGSPRRMFLSPCAGGRALRRDTMLRGGPGTRPRSRPFVILSDDDVFIDALSIRANLRICERYDCATGFKSCVNLTEADTESIRRNKFAKGIDVTTYRRREGPPFVHYGLFRRDMFRERGSRFDIFLEGLSSDTKQDPTPRVFHSPQRGASTLPWIVQQPEHYLGGSPITIRSFGVSQAKNPPCRPRILSV